MSGLRDRLKGFTLIELCIVIVATLIMTLPLVLLFTQALQGQALGQIMEKNILLAQAMMEQLLVKDFYNLEGFETSSPVAFSTLPAYGADFANYSFEVAVDYINPNPDILDQAAVLPQGARSNFIWLGVSVFNNSFPNKIVRLDTILTPAGTKAGYLPDSTSYYQHQ